MCQRTHVFRRAHCAHVQRVVIAFKHGAREIIEACFAAMALLALAIRMVCLSSATDPLLRRAMRAPHPFGPVPLAYGFIKHRSSVRRCCMRPSVVAMFQLLLENNVRVSWTCNFLLATKEVTYRH